jgi:hypothetical protein
MEDSFRLRKSPKISPENAENIEHHNSDPDLTELEHKHEEKHASIWATTIGGRRRVVSLGDLKYDLEEEVYILLPFYVEGKEVVKMKVIKGVIKDIITNIITSKEDVPRETNLKSFKIGNRTEYVKSWAKDLVIDNWKDNTNDAYQTMVMSYRIKLSPEFKLTQDQLSQLYKTANTQGCFPFDYDLEYKDSTIEVAYRYLLGTVNECQKIYSGICRKEFITAQDIEQHLKNLKLNTGTFVRYVDDGSRRNSGIVHFIVIDHICSSPVDVKFVIKCDKEPVRILAISKIYPFDVRLSYDVSKFHCFHSLERYEYEILETKQTSVKDIDSVRNILFEMLNPMKVYIIKKSLCKKSDIDSHVYANKEGDYQLVSKYENPFDQKSEPKRGFKFTGISLASYVKGLAYPEGNLPTEHDSYIFFHSKDYHELILDCNDPHFLEFMSTDENHKHFRDPNPKDVILAVPFVCDRDQFKGKVNLRWFYPEDEFRLLHLYITSKGENPYFKELTKNIKTLRLKFCKNKTVLALFDLYYYGLSEENPTLKTEFTQMFLKKYFWWDM